MLEMNVKVTDWPGAGDQQDQSVPLPVYSAGGCATNVACFAGRFGGDVNLYMGSDKSVPKPAAYCA